MLYQEMFTKVNDIIEFLVKTKVSKYEIVLRQTYGLNEMCVPVYSEGEMMNIITSVNLAFDLPFFKFGEMIKVVIKPSVPVFLLIKPVI